MLRALIVALTLVLAAGVAGAEDAHNGFDLAGVSVATDAIVAGGPPRDGIPRVDDPIGVVPSEATWVGANNPVLGVAIGDGARSYPVHLIERHQVVNDEIGGVPVVVTYDPLAGAPRAYERRVGERTLRFGISGLIYNHNFLLYDLETESLWVQYTGEAISGPLKGTKLVPRRIHQLRHDAWNARHPTTTVLARPLPDRIDYSHSPFLSYATTHRLLFPVNRVDERFHPKEVVLTLRRGDTLRAYLGSVLTEKGGVVEDRLGDAPVKVAYDGEEAVFAAEIADDVVVAESYWFSVAAFDPDVEVFGDPR